MLNPMLRIYVPSFTLILAATLWFTIPFTSEETEVWQGQVGLSRTHLVSCFQITHSLAAGDVRGRVQGVQRRGREMGAEEGRKDKQTWTAGQGDKDVQGHCGSTDEGHPLRLGGTQAGIWERQHVRGRIHQIQLSKETGNAIKGRWKNMNVHQINQYNWQGHEDCMWG